MPQSGPEIASISSNACLTDSASSPRGKRTVLSVGPITFFAHVCELIHGVVFDHIERYIARIKDSSISTDDLKVWDKDGKEHIFKSHDELRKYYNDNVLTMTDFRIRTEMEHVLKSIERCMMFRFWATNDSKYAVPNPLFNKKFKQKQQKARSKMYKGEDDNDESESEGEDNDGPEPQVTGMLNFSNLQ